jgi:hypothetical protein
MAWKFQEISRRKNTGARPTYLTKTALLFFGGIVKSVSSTPRNPNEKRERATYHVQKTLLHIS